MKKKILAIFTACIALAVGTMAFSACDGFNFGGNGGNGEQDGSEGENIQISADEWNTEISKFKGFDGLKSYTIDFAGEVEALDVTESISSKIYVDRENRKIYSPESKSALISDNSSNLVYYEMGESYDFKYQDAWNSIDTTVCNVKELQYDKNGLSLIKTNCLDYGDAEKLFSQYCGLAMLENIKYNGEVIKLEDAYEKFTYDEDTKSYTASVELISGFTRSIIDDKVLLEDENFYISLNVTECYSYCKIEIAFQQESFTMTAKIVDEKYTETYTLKIYDFNKTEIVLSDEDRLALGE